jgi:hypothetical protein
MRILQRDPVSHPGNMREVHAAETRCGGQADGIITRDRHGKC